jgi:hypothetical protein
MQNRNYIGRSTLILGAALVAVVAAGCVPGADAEHTADAVVEAPAGPQQISISTKDYFFVAPEPSSPASSQWAERP